MGVKYPHGQKCVRTKCRKIALFFQEGEQVGITGRNNITVITSALKLCGFLNVCSPKSGLHRSIPAETIVKRHHPSSPNPPFRRVKSSKKWNRLRGKKKKPPHLFCQTRFFGDVAVLLVPPFSLTATQRHVAVIT